MFTTNEKKAIVFAMNAMVNADGYKHPNEKNLYNVIYQSLNIDSREASSIMAYMLDASTSLLGNSAFEEHLDVIRGMNIEKKKDLISILTTLAAIDGNIDNNENQLLTHYRIVCDLPYTEYSTTDAVKNATKFIIR